MADFVENPTKTNIFFGFESAVKESIDNFLRNPRSLDEEVGSICDRLLRLAEAVGAVRLYYPEAMLQRRDSLDCESLLDSISSEIGYQVRFPNPYPNEFGLQTSRGIASYRAIQAIYQAWRLRQLTEVYGHGIIEIGGGLGRTACYSRLMQVTNDYTIVDLPLSIVAQAIFLSKIFGEEIVCLPGEKHIPGSIRLETPNWYLEQRPWAAIVMNVDSLPEMDIVQAEKYASVSAANSSVVLSINHEFNAFKVSDLRAYKDVPRSRHPYWVRKGYVEEFFLTGKRASTVQRHGFLSRIASAMIGTPTS